MTTLTRSPRVAAALVVLVGVLAGCSAILGIESDRHVVTPFDAGDDAAVAVADAAPPSTDAPDDAPAAPKKWACLSDPVPSAPAGSLLVKLFFNDVSSASSGTAGRPIVGADVHACSQLDVSCASPFGGVKTDDGGIAALTVPGGFDGFYEVHADGYSPAVLTRTPQLASEAQQQGLANISLLSQGAALAGVTQDPALGIAIVSVADCDTNPASGMIFEVGTLGPNEKVVYLTNKLPSRTASQTDLSTGSALIFNVPPGTLTVNVSFAADHRPLRTVSTIARQGWVSFIQIRPDQSKHVAP